MTPDTYGDMHGAMWRMSKMLPFKMYSCFRPKLFMHLTLYINCSVFMIALTSLSVELISYHYCVEQLLIDTSFLLKRMHMYIHNTFMNIGYTIGRPVT